MSTTSFPSGVGGASAGTGPSRTSSGSFSSRLSPTSGTPTSIKSVKHLAESISTGDRMWRITEGLPDVEEEYYKRRASNRRSTHSVFSCSSQARPLSSISQHASMLKGQQHGSFFDSFTPVLNISKRLVRSAYFVSAIHIAILVSAILMGVQAEMPHAASDSFWQVSEEIFATVFAMEMVLKVFVGGRVYFMSPWNLLDFFIALVSITYAWVLPRMFNLDSTGPNLGIVKAFRLLRLFRILRIMKAVPELRMVIEGIVASFRALFWVCTLLALVVYIFAIFFVEVVGKAGTDVYPGCNRTIILRDNNTIGPYSKFNNFEYFGDLGRSMLSLFSVSVLAEWDSMVRPIWQFQPAAILMFIGLVFITSFGIVNVIIGVIVERTTESMREMEVSKLERRLEEQMHAVECLSEIIWDTPAAEVHSVTRAPFRTLSGNQEILSLLNELDFPKGFTLDDVYTMLDHGGQDGISKKEFEDGMYHLIFGNEFQRACMHHLVLGRMKETQKRIGDIETSSVRHSRHASFQADLRDIQASSRAVLNEVRVVLAEVKSMRHDSRPQTSQTSSSEVLGKSWPQAAEVLRLQRSPILAPATQAGDGSPQAGAELLLAGVAWPSATACGSDQESWNEGTEQSSHPCRSSLRQLRPATPGLQGTTSKVSPTRAPRVSFSSSGSEAENPEELHPGKMAL